MKYELKSYSFGETIGKGLNLYFNNFIVLILISLILLIPSSLVEYSQSMLFIKGDRAGVMVLFLLRIAISLAVGAFVSGVIIKIASNKYLDRQVPLSSYFRQVLPFVFPLLGLAILEGIVIGLSMILLVVPGIIVAIGLSVATNILVIEKRGIIASMKRSWNLTMGKKWTIFGILLVVIIIQVIIIAAGQSILKEVLFTKGIENVQDAMKALKSYFIFNHIITAIINPIQACVIVVIYFNLRIEKEGFNIEHLAEQFSMAGPLEVTKQDESTKEEVAE